MKDPWFERINVKNYSISSRDSEERLHQAFRLILTYAQRLQKEEVKEGREHD